MVNNRLLLVYSHCSSYFSQIWLCFTSFPFSRLRHLNNGQEQKKRERKNASNLRLAIKVPPLLSSASSLLFQHLHSCAVSCFHVLFLFLFYYQNSIFSFIIYSFYYELCVGVSNRMRTNKVEHNWEKSWKEKWRNKRTRRKRERGGIQSSDDDTRPTDRPTDLTWPHQPPAGS